MPRHVCINCHFLEVAERNFRNGGIEAPTVCTQFQRNEIRSRKELDPASYRLLQCGREVWTEDIAFEDVAAELSTRHRQILDTVREGANNCPFFSPYREGTSINAVQDFQAAETQAEKDKKVTRLNIAIAVISTAVTAAVTVVITYLLTPKC